MAFVEITDLNCEVTTALGGRNKTTGKANPTKIEGYFLGSKSVESRKAKTGFAKLHIFKTEDGNVGVWGKTDLDRKLSSAVPGTMIRVTQNGMVPTPNGEMYKYKVEVDSANTLEGYTYTPAAASVSSYEESADSYTSTDTAEAFSADEEEILDEVAPAKAVAPKRVATTPDAARQAKVQALLNGHRTKI